MENKEWYLIENGEDINTPALCVYPDRIKENLRRIIRVVPTDRLRPHVKTHKMASVAKMQLHAGITKFKCATIAEAEMLGSSGAPDVLLAYPLTGTGFRRFLRLVNQFTSTRFSCVLDSVDTGRALGECFADAAKKAVVYIDLNVGMNRTGILPAKAEWLFDELEKTDGITVAGLHVYDGQIHDTDPALRRAEWIRACADIPALRVKMEKTAGRPLNLVAGGSPTFLFHAETGDREVSPGTFIFWDEGYRLGIPEQDFLVAALLVCRVVSIPAQGKICVDLGYKSVSSEKPQPRVFFLNAPEAVPSEQSEEHLVLEVPDTLKYKVGDLLYGVPRHICPSVALYDEACVIEKGQWTGEWPVTARKRRISI